MRTERVKGPRPRRLWAVVIGIVLSAMHATGAPPVQLGVDRLVAQEFSPIAGMRVGLITNPTGVDSLGRPTADLLHVAPQVELVRLFGPEHGIRGELDQSMIEDQVDGPTGLPVVSLYGPRRQPEAEHLVGLDALVFDVQDIGCRFYTYIATMKLAMQAAAEAGLTFVVLDRPNPIGGVVVEGPILEPGGESFVGCHALPIRHGMTIGELARLFAQEGPDGKSLDLDLRVVPCTGWRRSMLADQTNQLWIDPSPNMRRFEQAVLYPGIGLLETTNLSVGRGTDTPFELIGAPWIEPRALAEALHQEALRLTHPESVSFLPRYFTPTSSKFANQRCGGIDIVLRDAEQHEAVELGLLVAVTLRRLYPDAWQTDRLGRLLIHSSMHQALNERASFEELKAMAEAGVDDFRKRRASVLVYTD